MTGTTMSEMKRTDEDIFAEGMNVFERRINNMGFNNKEVVEVVSKHFLQMHRTLQQNMIRFLAYTIQRLAKYHNENENRFDARNESSVRWIKKVAEIEEYFPFI